MNRPIVVDLDGTILDCRRRHVACYREVLTKLGGTPLSEKRYWGLKRRAIPTPTILTESGDESLIEEFKVTWQGCIEAPEFLALDRPYALVAATLAQWRKLGHPIIMVTLRQSPQALAKQLTDLQLAGLFDAWGVAGPQPGEKAASALALAGQFGARPIAWVGDTEKDAEAALQVGCPFLGLSQGLRTSTILRDCGASQVASRLDRLTLPGA